MYGTEEVFLALFAGLREHLREEPGVGMALKAEGRSLTLRIRSQQAADDERRPYFAIVVGAAERGGAFRITYKPSGLPSAPRQVTIVDADSADTLLGLVRAYIEAEQRRLADFRQRG